MCGCVGVLWRTSVASHTFWPGAWPGAWLYTCIAQVRACLCVLSLQPPSCSAVPTRSPTPQSKHLATPLACLFGGATTQAKRIDVKTREGPGGGDALPCYTTEDEWLLDTEGRSGHGGLG